MEKIIVITAILLALGAGYAWQSQKTDGVAPTMSDTEGNVMNDIIQKPEVIVSDLEIPWGLAFLPSGEILVTERGGRLVKISEEKEVISVSGVAHRGEGGLLGLALHPNFSENNYIYLYLTTASGSGLINRVERYTLNDTELSERVVILDNIPGAQYHDGGRLAFGPDGYLYITTGDAGQERLSQDTDSLAGKILRVADDGSIPEDNPFGNEVYSYGHRNPQGLTWDDTGRLWSTEHGRSGVQSGFDEVNLIEKGGNYGWPDSQGDEVAADTIGPIVHSGSNTTWAPASVVYKNGSLYFGGLRGQAIYQVTDLDSEEPQVTAHFRGEYGRIRTVTMGPDGNLYLTTSNRDGRGDPAAEDDRILRVSLE